MMIQRPSGGVEGGGLEGTLDEPISETVMRDFRNVGKKLKYVLMPKARNEAGAGLREWDLWGPLILCLLLAITLWAHAYEDQKKLVFALAFMMVWFGAAVVTVNAVLIGGTVSHRTALMTSFFQSVCVLGYSLFPMDIAALLCSFIPPRLALLKFIFLAAAVYWATGTSSGFLSGVVPEGRKPLAIYPAILFYMAIAWIILLV